MSKLFLAIHVSVKPKENGTLVVATSRRNFIDPWTGTFVPTAACEPGKRKKTWIKKDRQRKEN